jgi:hypothetical protein
MTRPPSDGQRTPNTKERGFQPAIAMAMGIALGAVVGVVAGNIAIGVAVGLALAVAAGWGLARART